MVGLRKCGRHRRVSDHGTIPAAFRLPLPWIHDSVRGLRDGQRGRGRIARVSLGCQEYPSRPVVGTAPPTCDRQLRVGSGPRWKGELPPPPTAGRTPWIPSLFRYVWRHTRAEQIFLLPSSSRRCPSTGSPLRCPSRSSTTRSRAAPSATARRRRALRVVRDLPRFPRRRTCHVFPDGLSLEQMPYLFVAEPLVPASRAVNGAFKYYHQHPQGAFSASACCGACASICSPCSCASGRRTSRRSSRRRPPA